MSSKRYNMSRKSIFLLLAASFIFLIVLWGGIVFQKDKIVIGLIDIECDNCEYERLDNKIEPYCSNCGKHFKDCKVDLNSTIIIYYCPFCKEVASIRDTYCGHCGESLEEVNERVISNLKSDRLKYK